MTRAPVGEDALDDGALLGVAGDDRSRRRCVVGLSASSRISSRMPAMRELLSGPWQRKQVSAMIGRMSRLKRTSACRRERQRQSDQTARETVHSLVSVPSQYTIAGI